VNVPVLRVIKVRIFIREKIRIQKRHDENRENGKPKENTEFYKKTFHKNREPRTTENTLFTKNFSQKTENREQLRTYIPRKTFRKKPRTENN